MSKGQYAYLVYQKDFAEKGNDRYFLYKDGAFFEVDSFTVTNLDCFVVTHDFWLISNSLYKKHSQLPKKVIDVVLLSKIVAGVKSIKGDNQPWDISQTVKPLYKDASDFEEYVKIYYRRSDIDENVYMLFSHKLAEYADTLFDKAYEMGESERFFSVELPLYNVLVTAACKGIRVSQDIIREHKDQLKIDFYQELKAFAEKHDVLYEIPHKKDVLEKLYDLGYDVESYALDYLIDFLPSKDGYTDDLRSLQKVNKSHRVFNSISSSKSRICPIVESHWTSTARIYHKSPSIQNISKRYRNIFIADEGLSLNYVDYDQFEVGIMAALSGDTKMKYIYENMDAYKNLSEVVFGTPEYRKKTKVMFLSYTYGMSMENIMSSVRQLGGDVKKVKEYFSEFDGYESWKQSVYDEYFNNGRISTVCANFLNRKLKGDLSNKEKRTVVSHIVQGTGSYIFKKSLIDLNHEDGVDILIPMHDAVLFQHPDDFDPNRAVHIFENNMAVILNGKVKGKASIERFYSS
ncbi:MAG: DNA polymerase [Candidatus Polarisedimenticolaceae bacterium]|nr:DNA polymerase [Candidatus Polarisedimenticolaceae bacterium]